MVFGVEFKEIATGVRARDTEISFKDLLDKMIEYENVLKRFEEDANTLIPSARVVARSYNQYDKNKK